MNPAFIKNYLDLIPPYLTESQSLLRKTILNALELAIKSVMPKNLMAKALKIENGTLIIQNDQFPLKNFKDICIIGGGKAVAHMTAYLEKILSNVPGIKYRGIINVPENLFIDNLELSESIQINFASHPIPNESGVIGVRKMIELINSSSKKSLILFLVSGGGSALLPFPRREIQLKDLQVINALLLDSGASIHEINVIRKHLSDLKGGNLARKIFEVNKGTLISLIISDVVGNDLDSIASGPSVADSSTFKDVFTILNKYELFDKVPNSIRSLVEEGLNNKALETPKLGDECFDNVHNYLIGSIETGVLAIKNFLKKEGYTVKYFSDKITGEARVFGERLINESIVELRNYHNWSKRSALIGTGELTVTIKGKGIGGRNQEMLLSFLNKAIVSKIDGDFCILAANLDGIEGNSNAMGALVDNEVCKKALESDLDITKYLNHNDSNSAFKLLGTEIITGPTGCNVNDIMIFLYGNYFEER
jgi:glycerate 2-kinase